MIIRSWIRILYFTTASQNSDAKEKEKFDDTSPPFNMWNWIDRVLDSQPLVWESELKNSDLHLITQKILSQLTLNQTTLDTWGEKIKNIRQTFGSKEILTLLLEKNFSHCQFSVQSLHYLENKTQFNQLKKSTEYPNSSEYSKLSLEQQEKWKIDDKWAEKMAEEEKLTKEIENFEKTIRLNYVAIEAENERLRKEKENWEARTAFNGTLSSSVERENLKADIVRLRAELSKNLEANKNNTLLLSLLIASLVVVVIAGLIIKLKGWGKSFSKWKWRRKKKRG